LYNFRINKISAGYLRSSAKTKSKAGIYYSKAVSALDGKDLRPLPLCERKAKLAKLLARAPVGIVFNEHTDEDGAVVFRHACEMGLEGIVSKRLTAPHRSGPPRAPARHPTCGLNAIARRSASLGPCLRGVFLKAAKI
jgi:hypothetical protein